MDRRFFVSALAYGFVSAKSDARAQAATKVHRVGYLTHGTMEQTARYFGAIRKGLLDLGYTEGRNVAFLPRYGNGALERLPELAADLVRAHPDVIVTGSQPLAIAARRATTTISVVMVGVADPVGIGLISSLARPGGNVTGLSIDAGPEMGGKSLELLSELVPRLSRVGVLRHAIYSAEPYAELAAAARKANVTIELVEIRNPDEIESGFARLKSLRVGAAIILGPFFWVHRQLVAELALRNRLPAFHALKDFADVGLLVSYGANLDDLYRRAASYVDRILRGAKAAELPVEQPTKFDLVINLRTAKVLGIAIPQSMLARANEVIQ